MAFWDDLRNLFRQGTQRVEQTPLREFFLPTSSFAHQPIQLPRVAQYGLGLMNQFTQPFFPVQTRQLSKSQQLAQLPRELAQFAGQGALTATQFPIYPPALALSSALEVATGRPRSIMGVPGFPSQLESNIRLARQTGLGPRQSALLGTAGVLGLNIPMVLGGGQIFRETLPAVSQLSRQLGRTINQPVLRPGFAKIPQVVTDEIAPETLRTIQPKISTKKYPNNFFPEEEFNFQVGRTESETVRNLRAETIGIRNAQVLRGNYLAEDITKLAPKEQKGMFWYQEALRAEQLGQGSATDILRRWLADTDPLIDPYRESIRQAANLSSNARLGLNQGQKYYQEAGQRLIDQDLIAELRNNYQNRIYEKQPLTSAQLSQQLKTGTYHQAQRIYETAYDSVKAGNKLADVGYADALSIYNEEIANVYASRQLFTEMSNTPLGNSNFSLGKWYNSSTEIPEGFKAVKMTIYGKVFAAPEKIANGLAALNEPNFFNRISVLKKLQKYQGLVKTIDLSYSFFHHFTMAAQLFYQTKFGLDILLHWKEASKALTSGTFRPLEIDFVRNTGMTTKIASNQDILRNLVKGDDSFAKLSKLPGPRQALQLAQANTSFLFDRMQRFLKVMDYHQKSSNWVSTHQNATNAEITAAKRGFARESNAAFGGLNWQDLGITNTTQSLLKFVLLAPDWTLSNVLLGKYAFEGGTAGAAARAHIFTALVSGTLATQALNYMITGHFTDKNPKGHEFEVQVAPRVYISLYRGGIGDFVRLYSNLAESGIAGVGRFAASKLSPLARTAVSALSGTDYYGKINQDIGKGPLASTKDFTLSMLASILPIPFGLQSAVRYAQTINPQLAGYFAALSGLGRVSPQQLTIRQRQLVQGLQGKVSLEQIDRFITIQKDIASINQIFKNYDQNSMNAQQTYGQIRSRINKDPMLRQFFTQAFTNPQWEQVPMDIRIELMKKVINHINSQQEQLERAIIERQELSNFPNLSTEEKRKLLLKRQRPGR